MSEGAIVLLAILVTGVLTQNDLVAISALLMLLARFTGSPHLLRALDNYSVELGVIFLLMGLLLPFAYDKVQLLATGRQLLTVQGILVILVGVAAAFLGAQGVALLKVQPEVMLGLIIGSTIGVAFFGGIPVGPLVASGLVWCVYRAFGH